MNQDIETLTQDEESSLPAHLVKVRERVVMVDRDLAQVFDVETRALNQALKRNIERFGEDYAFQLSKDEFANLKSQTVISSQPSWGGHGEPDRLHRSAEPQPRYQPYRGVPRQARPASHP